MGYYSNIDGELSFSRPLNRKESEPIRLLLEKDIWNVYVLDVVQQDRETDDGTLTIVQAVALKPIEDSVKAYEWERVLREAMALLPTDVTVSGYFERKGEGRGDGPDLERLYVKGRQVLSVKPEIVWPEP